MLGIYKNFCENKGYDEKMRSCIESTVQKLKENDTTAQKPGMLLGKIQSGKTRAFIGVIGLAFDEGYDLVVVLTKGTKALTKQTYERLYQEFDEHGKFIENDVVRIYDIMNMSEDLTQYTREKKLIFVVKKETHNLDRLANLFEKYDDFKTKQILIVDDEADYASIGFKKDRGQIDDISVNTLAKKINRLRNQSAKTDFLQVTATPYSLYLQPKDMVVNRNVYKPVRPAFTVLVPIHDQYIGSEFYFEESEDPDSPAFCLHIDVPEKELNVLGKPDQRYRSNILGTSNLEIFRFAIINFLVGGTIRRLQENPKNYKCSFLIHTETSKAKHTWQVELVSELVSKLADADSKMLKKLIKKSYEDFSLSVPRENLPTLSDVLQSVTHAIKNEYIGIIKINSERQIEALLDRKGQLRLDNPFNVFIGGQILDRGITIENLISFFYGRNPGKFQQDTVLQHSRMYGARSERDISVTRFYTSARIYDAMKKMHHFDSGLREAFEKGQHGDDGVVFLQKDDSGDVHTCAPSKILISSTETIRPYRRLLPRGMMIVSQTKMSKIDPKIDEILFGKYNLTPGEPVALINWEDAVKVLELIHSSYDFSASYNRWDVSYYKAIIRHLCEGHQEPGKNGKIHCVITKNRNSGRTKGNGMFNDAPDDGNIDRPLAKKVAQDLPLLQLFHQNGKTASGWRDVPFWWPVLVCPKNTKTSVFAAQMLEERLV